MTVSTMAAPVDLAALAAGRRHYASRTVIYGFLAVFALIYLLPLFVVIANSFRPLPGSPS